MISPMHGTFYIADNSVQPLEYLAIIFGAITGDDRLMLALGLPHSGKQCNPSEMTRLPGRICFVAQKEISSRVNPLR